MRIGRTLPPAAAPLGWKNIISGLCGIMSSAAECERFSAELKQYFNKQHCFLFSSGKAAMTVALMALKKIHPGRDLVLIPAYTCYSVPAAIVKAGLTVALCDIAPGTFDFNYKQLGKWLDDDRLLCVVPTHLFGCPADIDRLQDMIGSRPIPIIEDAAQAFGARTEGVSIGSIGAVSMFSLGRGKSLSTVSGGILLVDDDEIAVVIEQEFSDMKECSSSDLVLLILTALAMKSMGHPTMFWLPKSLPFLRLGETMFNPDFPIRTMSGFQAGLSRGWEKQVEIFKSQRLRNSQYWHRLDMSGMISPYLKAPTVPDLVRFPVLIADESVRRHLIDESDRLGLGVAPGYPGAIDSIAELRDIVTRETFPVAQKLAQCLVTLPVHPQVSAADHKRIAKLLRRPFRKVSWQLLNSMPE